MVVFVDFEADDDEMSRAALPSPEVVIARRHIQKLKAKSDQTARSASQDDEQDQEERILLTDASNNDDGTISKAEEETGLNINSFSTLLACYPYVSTSTNPTFPVRLPISSPRRRHYLHLHLHQCLSADS